MRSVSDAEAGSLVWLEAYGREVTKRHLPSDARVCFKLPNGEVEVRIDKRRNGEALEISSSHGGLIVLPGVSNQIWIKIER